MPDPALDKCSSCFFPTEFHQVPLIKVQSASHDTKILTFALPTGVSLSLPVCACILLKADPDEGEPVIRPYTPISSEQVKGSFDLLVKVYPQGQASSWLNSLSVGAMVGFKHIPFNIKVQYPFAGTRKLNMICGGTGITPMYQALLKIVETPSDQLEVTCLVGNRTVEDILLREQLETVVKKGNGRIKVIHVMGDTPDQAPIPGWTGELGWVDEAKIKQHCYPPASDVLTLVCGVPALYDALCGPRTDPELTEGTVLHRLGYTTAMISKM